MPLSIRLSTDDDRPLYVQLADALREAVAEGELRPGDRLPSVRRLADGLALNPATVVSAYRILVREGMIVSRLGSGAYVAEDWVAPSPEGENAAAPVEGNPPTRGGIAALSRGDAEARVSAAGDVSASASELRVEASPQASSGAGPASGSTDAPRILDLAANAPHRGLFPLADVKRFLIEAVDTDGGRAFEYEDASGYPALRGILADRLSEAGPGTLSPSDIHVVSGAQQGLDLIARILLRRGDIAVVESPGYRGVRDVFVASGAKVEALPVGEHGLDLDALERLASSRPLRLVYVNPSFQNPTGACWPAERRERLASMAVAYGFYVVEDDLYSDLAYGGKAPASIKSFDRAGHVFYVKSFSKSLMPGLRIACLVAPRLLQDRLEAAKRAVDLSTNGLLQRVLGLFLSSGSYDAHVASMRAYYAGAAAACLAALKPLEARGVGAAMPGGGFNLWISLPPSLTGSGLAAAVKARGVLVAPEIRFRQEATSREDRHLRVCLAAEPEADLVRGMDIIAQYIQEVR